MASFKLITVPLTILFAVLVFRAAFIFKSLPPPEACRDIVGHERIKINQEILDRFLGALSIPTISYKIKQYEPIQLQKLADFIESSFPLIHKTNFITREKIANYSLLYTVEGADKSLRPYLLTSHLDVVPPVRESWSSDPFKATVKEDNYIYARGTIDAKHLLMSMLEAFESMLKNGFKPQRGFYLVFGHDEEVGGTEGAQTMSKLLAQRIKASNWGQLEYILDEGNIISKTKFPGLDANIALIGVVEKGMVTMKINTTGSVGHGSMPPQQTAITKLSGAIGKFHSNIMPSFLGRGVEREMIDIFATYSSWPYKLVYANFWLFKPIFGYIFESDPALNSLIRTSTAVTMINGGTKENVLPDSAAAYVNHRVHQLQKIADVLDFDRKLIDDPTINVEVYGYHSEPSSVAPYKDEEDSYGYNLVKQSVLQIYPGTVVVPSVFLAASDSRWYQNLSNSIYKFSAIAVHLEEMKRFHGHDERISVENYENLINFFHHLILNSDAVKLNFNQFQRTEL